MNERRRIPVGPTAADPEQAVSGPAGPAPVRPERSVRRTSTIDMTWPGGLGTPLRLDGRARDAHTLDPHDAPIVISEATTRAAIGDLRTIEELDADPRPPRLDELVGCRGGGHLRHAIAEAIPEEVDAGTLVHLLLDDISGASLIAGFAWSRWTDRWRGEDDAPERPSMEGVCIGFAPGSRALGEDAITQHRVRAVPSLVNDADPHGWHELAELPPVSMRRARRIDVWRDGDVIRIDSAFQDSAGDPEHGRVAVHEYRLGATADPESLTLTSVSPDPRVLPYLECPSAVETAARMVGAPLGGLRALVLERLARTNGCTHLNDALRALAEVPRLLEVLDERP